tara:strand:- start:44 stop:304 length:261 start_codon:yes stop_codon:yes gene_type:complete
MIKVIVVAWFTFILAVMSIAPISLTVKWIKSIIKEDTNFSLKKIFFIVTVICFSVAFSFLMVFGVAIQFWIPIFPWLDRFSFPLGM